MRQNAARETAHRGLVLDEQDGTRERRPLGGFRGGFLCFLAQARLDGCGIERLQTRRGQQLARQDRRATRRTLDFVQLLRIFRGVTDRFEQELGVDLDDGEEIVEFVGDETGGFVRFFERPRTGLSGFVSRDSFLLCGLPGCLLQVRSRRRNQTRILQAK